MAWSYLSRIFSFRYGNSYIFLLISIIFAALAAMAALALDIQVLRLTPSRRLPHSHLLPSRRPPNPTSLNLPSDSPIKSSSPLTSLPNPSSPTLKFRMTLSKPLTRPGPPNLSSRSLPPKSLTTLSRLLTSLLYLTLWIPPPKSPMTSSKLLTSLPNPTPLIVPPKSPMTSPNPSTSLPNPISLCPRLPLRHLFMGLSNPTSISVRCHC